MKKFFGMLLILAMISCTAIPAFAASEPQFGSGSTNVTAYSYGSFEYSIPASAHFEKNMGNECKITIMNADLLETDSVIITVSNINEAGGVTLKHTTKEDVTANLYFYTDSNYGIRVRGDISEPLFTIPFENLDGFSSHDFYVNALLDEDAKAGQYSGVIYFDLSIVSNS